jgi:hypothetical protein
MIYLILAAIFNLIMDTLTHHFNTSVFKGLNPKWWNPNESWQYNNNFLGVVHKLEEVEVVQMVFMLLE